jgi:glutaredoxin
MVKIYGFSGCPYCKELKELLTKDGVQFIDVDIDLPENQEEFNKIMEISGADEVPIVKVGTQLLVPNVSFNSIKEAAELTKKFLV